MWVQPPPWATFVAVEDDGTDDGTGDGTGEEEVLGTAKCGPVRPGGGAHVATASFMVSPAARGRGVGRALGEHVLAWARAQGYLAVQFNAVVETNTAAVALWTSLGFAIVGTVPQAFDHPEHGYVGLHVMHRFL
nr:GNAT family N-acetyltransferase [Kineococcus aurantiacus]